MKHDHDTGVLGRVKRRALAILLVAVLLAAASCGSDSSTDNEAADTSDATSSDTSTDDGDTADEPEAADDDAAGADEADEGDESDTESPAATPEDEADEGSSAEDAAPDAERGTLRAILIAGDYSIFDPLFGGPANTQGQVMHLLFDALVRYEPGRITPDSIEPDLAESWETSDDGLVWTFHLREGVQFHDGYGELTAEDVVFTFERQKDPDNGGAYIADYENVASIEAPDDYTVVMTLTEQDPFFLTSVANYHGGLIVSKAAVEERGEDFVTNPIGTGAFKLEEYRPTDQIIFVANDDYWRGAPKLARLEYKFIPDGSSQLLALQAGEVDIGRIDRDDTMIEGLEADGMTVDLVASINWGLHMNTSVEPFGNPLVREALAYATDRESFVAFFGASSPLQRNLPDGTYGVLEDVPEEYLYEYDLDRAKELMAEAGYADGFTIESIVPDISIWPIAMQVIQEQWAELGITINLNSVDSQTFGVLSREGNEPFIIHGGSRPPLADIYLSEWFTTGGASNWSEYSGIDDLVAQARAELVAGDEAATFDTYAEAQIQILEDMVALPLMSQFTPLVRSSAVNLGYDVVDSLTYGYQITNETTLDS